MELEVLQEENDSQQDSSTAEDLAVVTTETHHRFFVSIDSLFNPTIARIPIVQFFQKCRINGFCFDMEERLGTAFNLMQCMCGGVLGILCVGWSQYDALSELAQVMDFLMAMVNDRSVMATRHAHGGDGNLIVLHATIKYLVDKLKPRDSHLKNN
eukprot:TRINITY_DN64872_c0_g1_i1.p2 TRINITY_DN64872_c0_g1~~TRINITY_DN64872_c0_g1_i1.p2  ORF type:complete len:164 (+),score=18.20 TRINITY_DN64872_c0_g1_i1:28-492(+)